jgi:threonine synthase
MSASTKPLVAYASTRDKTLRTSAAEALLQGLAPDGGLFVPSAIPPLPDAWTRQVASIADIGSLVLPAWLGDALSPDAISEVAHDALNFPVPLISLDGQWRGVYLLELFHGPTLSFKDFGARTMARLMSRILPQSERLTILVATSGDTGSAVADGFAGQENIDVVLLYPSGQVSEVQERQLIVERPGVRAYAVDGTFDDCQRMVKEAFADEELRSIKLSSANSINIGRLLPQMLYYLEALRVGGFETPPIFCVPSGNLGNLTAGVMAHLAGMPADGFLAAHNANDFFPRFLATGSDDGRDSVRTYSNAMDVGVPSNFERLRTMLDAASLGSLISAESVTDAETLESMRRVHYETGYVADPHTAVGLESVRRRRDRGDQRPWIVLSTAHPAKFPDVVEKALGVAPAEPETLAELRNRASASRSIPPTLPALREELLSTNAPVR